jgi:glycosyltransferase involved in cell wall biosynthesis
MIGQNAAMPREQPSVSLVMPVWRPRADWLRAAVTSALAQSDCAIELVVVDDGNDEPVEPMLGGVDDPRMRCVRIDHAGVSAARNAGTAAASGTHLRFADADDVLEPTSSARLLELANGTHVAHERTVMCNADLQPIGRVLGSQLEGSIAVDCLLGRFETHLSALLFPRWAVDTTGPWDESMRVSQDWDFILRCLDVAEARAGTGVASYYRRHPDSTTLGPTAAVHGDHGGRRVVEKYFERHPEQSGTGVERAAWTNLLAEQARSALYRRNFRRFGRRVLSVAPRSPSTALRLSEECAQQVARRLWTKVRRVRLTRTGLV